MCRRAEWPCCGTDVTADQTGSQLATGPAGLEEKKTTAGLSGTAARGLDLMARTGGGLIGLNSENSAGHPYVVGSVVGPVMTEISQDEAQVLLGAVQRLVVVAVVALLVT